MMSDVPRLLTDAEIAAIAERAEKATPGTWYAEKEGLVLDEFDCRVADCTWGDEGCPPVPNATFIAAARRDIPRLLADLQRYREWCRWLVDCEDMIALLPLIQEVRTALEESP